ncbi:U4 U6 small nuclear ribonucleoprotein PRP4 [Cryptosporidium andersoni]|uniref:U4 U6 small nuclear ribonucleoprotein PRP4 n=1 Tax=Cryptosporidium andersoni TaxID=117008 RepID=A0A1J4MWY4_9CRYT|nr:U4 U6 small nuclear ribonucleoprotein PRP4 [Cryptosporidium andersoni]
MLHEGPSVTVPTNDDVVKATLRTLGHPICYFGEGPYERRIRLSIIIEEDPRESQANSNRDIEQKIERFFTEGDEDLVAFRKTIAAYSIPLSYKRLKNARTLRENVDILQMEAHICEYLLHVSKQMTLKYSEVADSRPLMGCKFSPENKKIATFGMSCNIKIWDSEFLNSVEIFEGHKNKINDIDWISTDIDLSYIVSCDANSHIYLWNNNGVIARRFEDHEDTVNCVKFHPVSKYIISASNDETWRSWDIEKGKQVVIQEGHSRGINRLDIHLDGALLATGDLGGIVNIWDLRSGYLIMPLTEHVGQILSVKFSPRCGVTLATASDDNTIKIWDLRNAKIPLQHCIFGHTKRISEVLYEPKYGRYLISVAYDGYTKFWTTQDLHNSLHDGKETNLSGKKYTCFKILISEDHRISGIDISPNGMQVASVGFDRCIKLWSCSEIFNGVNVDRDYVF